MPKIGLGHKGSNQPVLGSDGFDRVFQGQDIVGSLQSSCKMEINLMLSESDLMMTGFDLQAHAGQAAISSVRTRTA
jgi:hypothetical protein